MALAATTAAVATATGSGEFRDIFHHCRGKVNRRRGNLDHQNVSGSRSVSSGSSPGSIRRRGLTFDP